MHARERARLRSYVSRVFHFGRNNVYVAVKVLPRSHADDLTSSEFAPRFYCRRTRGLRINRTRAAHARTVRTYHGRLEENYLRDDARANLNTREEKVARVCVRVIAYYAWRPYYISHKYKVPRDSRRREMWGRPRIREKYLGTLENVIVREQMSFKMRFESGFSQNFTAICKFSHTDLHGSLYKSVIDKISIYEYNL